MCEKLFTLCDLQLGAIVADLDRSVESVSGAATRLLRSNSPAVASTQLCDQAQAAAGEQLKELQKIVVGLQFHDELTQRINHIQALLRLIQDQSTLVMKPEYDAAEMLTTVSNIFSSGAEFTQLGKVFPEYSAANDIELVELF
jgi:hypothetical protein